MFYPPMIWRLSWNLAVVDPSEFHAGTWCCRQEALATGLLPLLTACIPSLSTPCSAELSGGLPCICSWTICLTSVQPVSSSGLRECTLPPPGDRLKGVACTYTGIPWSWRDKAWTAMRVWALSGYFPFCPSSSLIHDLWRRQSKAFYRVIPR